MDAKFGYECGGWHSINTSRPHGVGLWKYISRGGGYFLAIPDLIQGMGSRPHGVGL